MAACYGALGDHRKRGKERARGGGAIRRERGSEKRGRGGAWRLRASRREATRQEVARGEAGGGRGLSGARHASPLFVLLAEEEEDKGEEVGWTGQMGWPAVGLRVGCQVS